MYYEEGVSMVILLGWLSNRSIMPFHRYFRFITAYCSLGVFLLIFTLLYTTHNSSTTTGYLPKLEISLKVMNTSSWCLTIYICMRNSRGNNSFKNNSSATRRQYAQLGLVSIIIVKLYWILTKGCREKVFTRNVHRPTDRQTDRQAWLIYSPHVLWIWVYNK